MIEILYTPGFIRSYKKLPSALQDEVKEKIDQFRQSPKKPSLRTHKLKGRLKGQLSFSVNYKYRVVFQFDKPDVAALLEVGDHTIYQ